MQKFYARRDRSFFGASWTHPGPDWVEVDAPPSDGQQYTLDENYQWVVKVEPEVIPVEALNPNDISIGPAERLYTASTVEELRAVVLEILGL